MRNISNRFWEKNAIRSKDDGPGVDLVSDSSDSDDDSEAARAKKLRNLDSRIKRLLLLETGAVRLKSLETNEAVQGYESLLQAFVQKPISKKKRLHATNKLLVFLQEHIQILELYNQFAKMDRMVRKDRLLPQFEVSEEDEDDRAVGGETSMQRLEREENVRRAPAKNAHDNNDGSDEEGIVTQTLKADRDFDGPSMFNTKGLTAPSIFNQKIEATTEERKPQLVLHKRETPLAMEMNGRVSKRGRIQDMDGTPTQPSKKKRAN